MKMGQSRQGNGEWRQAAENADGPLGSAMFINHGKTELSNPPDEGDSKEAAAE